MQEQRNSNGGGFQNRDSFYSRMNSNMSIDRFTIRSNSPLTKSKISLIDAMDLQIPEQRTSDLYHNLLNDQRRSSNNNKRSSNISRNQLFSRISRQSDQMIEKNQNQHSEYQNERNSRQSNYKLIHQCNCTQNQCNRQHCSCYLYPNELCIIGLCCPNCITAKNEFLNKTQMNEAISSHNINGCLCKNIKCLKLYCRCFREGKKCDPTVCKCDGCENNVDGLLEKKKKRIQFQLRKQHYLQQNGQHSLRQNNHFDSIKEGKQIKIDSMSYSFINCACKRSHCLKKYCSCFFHNKPCTQACACEECQNIYDENDIEQERRRKQRYARHDDEEDDDQMDENNEGQIGRFLTKYERNFQNDEMNENMEFEPVNFDDIVGD